MISQPTNDLTIDQANWPEALATVITCKYDFGAGRALAFGIPTTKHFRITYNYFADGELHNGEFTSATAIPQGHLFPIRYNPNAPHDHAHPHATSATPAASRTPVFIVGVIGSLILSFAWFAILRGCH